MSKQLSIPSRQKQSRAFFNSLTYKPTRISKAKKQKKSLPGQLSLFDQKDETKAQQESNGHSN